MEEEIFLAKEKELYLEYEAFLKHLSESGKQDHESLQKKIDMLEEKNAEEMKMLQNLSQKSHSNKAAQLAACQLDYVHEMEQIVNKSVISNGFDSIQEEKTEEAALYAEYAIDFAKSSMRLALEAVYKAADLQLNVQLNDNVN